MSSTEQTWRGLLTVMEHSQASKQIYAGNKCNMASSQKNLKKYYLPLFNCWFLNVG